MVVQSGTHVISKSFSAPWQENSLTRPQRAQALIGDCWEFVDMGGLHQFGDIYKCGITSYMDTPVHEDTCISFQTHVKK